MKSADLKLENASPEKISKTGNIVLDRINKVVETQRTFKKLQSLDDQNPLPEVKEEEEDKFFYSLNEKLENEQQITLRQLESVDESSKQQSPGSSKQEAGDSIFGGILQDKSFKQSLQGSP